MAVPAQDSLWWPDGRRKQFVVYIISNNSMTLYIGITNEIARRAIQHFTRRGSQFTSRYRFDRLVYFEVFELARDAIDRETELKGWRREKKIALIKTMNPTWRNLLAPSSRAGGEGSRN